MGIEKFIASVCVQTAVYWASPTPDGYGGYTFTDPAEITCRWEDKAELITDGKGNQIISKAQLLVTHDLDDEGYLYLGSLGDLTAGEQADPLTIEHAYQIKGISKVPMIKSTDEFVRTVYL